MGRVFAGAAGALMLVAGGFFWWQGRDPAAQAPLVAQSTPPAPAEVPPEGDPEAEGVAPPMPPGADPRTREQKRFDRYDRNRDGIVTRVEMLSTRTNAFRKLDKDGNNLLSFEEWATKTAERFDSADANRDKKLSSAEFATTAPKPAQKKPECACD
jgi:hypothetical protein